MCALVALTSAASEAAHSLAGGPGLGRFFKAATTWVCFEAVDFELTYGTGGAWYSSRPRSLVLNVGFFEAAYSGVLVCGSLSARPRSWLGAASE